MALKSSREGLRKELVDYLGNLIIDNNLRNEIIKLVSDNFVTSESLNEAVNNLTMQITTESGKRIEADDTLQNNITAETTAREGTDTTLQNNINAEITARQEAISNLENLIGTSGLQMDLLWTNASPTSIFDSQTINVDYSNYKHLLFIIKSQYALDIYSSYLVSTNITDGKQIIGGVLTNNDIISLRIRYRSITLNSNKTTINFSIGYNWYYELQANDSSPSGDVAIPYKIYGIK